MNPVEWPWYETVTDGSIDQGDIIPECLVLHAVDVEDSEKPSADFRIVTGLVLTQTCDLEQSKVESVVLCAVWTLADVVLSEPSLWKEVQATAHRETMSLPVAGSLTFEADANAVILKSKALRKEFNAIMKGERPPFAMLEKHAGAPARPLSLVSFQQVYSLPLGSLLKYAAKATPRLRLRPPYREHVSHAFARYFGRIGLLQDVARFAT